MSNARNSLRTGQTVRINIFDGTDPDTRTWFGQENAEIIAPSKTPGIVIVRPFNSEDRIQVRIADIVAA
ncbi:hypothetical protein KHO57_gp012 [Mycobacterium phage Phabba]|uniref:Uncharacterized protein n=1 Tax=Mycobacterium phage Phabba TaxID=2027899 RepID=A0A249XS68_9CAUD|nr:hypothetical protein KHO57_gp012 [Mycobacterium phage Phabba]ASZ74587.1 hypothetical protein SEA_PHABBA_12 [Mycobacterium phage Phabba]